ncbi:MAG: hypothetical protein DHS20C15_25690 [Planctomycetota bacterium]|nr:MAG: hypothetical protein DHS20C15_25690 [Planctomycetota bacterium]
MRLSRRLVALLLLLTAFGGACAQPASELRGEAAPGPDQEVVAPSPTAEQAHEAEVEAWHVERERKLASPTGYLALVGLTWIGEGRHTVGSHPDSDIQLPVGRAPERLGEIVVRGEQLRFVAAEGQSVTVDGERVTELALRADTHADGRTTLEVHAPRGKGGADSDPSRASTDPSRAEGASDSAADIAFWMVRRGPRLGVRVRDAQSALRREYAGTARFPVDMSWRVRARFVPFAVPRMVSIPSVHGVSSQELLAGELQFELHGRTHSLLPLPESDGSYWLIFSDATSGDESYSGGRFLVTEVADADGSTWIDFNRSYNPPCAYSSVTTCPLPPEGNALSVPVRAGERAPASATHH